MKPSILALLTATTLLYSAPLVAAQEAQPPQETNAVLVELKTIVTKVQGKLKAAESKVTEADLATELKAFDELLAKNKDNKSDEVAQVLIMKAMLYAQVLENETKGKELMEQLKKDFPDSEPVAMLKRQEEAEKVRASLTDGATFPGFEEKDLDGKPLSLAAYKGKVVLIDFWATWCGPCVRELPNVMAAYEKHHARGFEIIGISLDESRAKLDAFIKQKNMTWPQYFDGEGWQNKLAQKYGVNSIPATYLLDGEGKIIGQDLRGEALEAAVAKALAAK